MTIAAQLSITPVTTTLPDAAFLKEKAASASSVIVYQPHIGEQQKQELCAGAVPFDIEFNKGKPSREYELFQLVHDHHKAIGLGDDVFWGLVSRKFELKAPTPFSFFLQEAEKARAEGFDCYVYNPMIGNCAIFVNTWEQGRAGHANFEQIINYMAQRGYNISPPQGLKSFFLCNYFCGNERFWSGYFAFCEKLLGELEDGARRGTPVGQAYAGSADYGRSPELTMRPFVIERLLGIYVEAAVKEGLKVSYYEPTKADFDLKFSKRLSDFFYPLYQRKIAFAETRNKADFDAWHALRVQVFQSPMLAFHADDPPEWTLLNTK